MLKIISLYIAYQINSLIRYLYWLYRLSKIKNGKGFKCCFPIIVEGKGKINIKDYCILNKGVSLKIAQSASLQIGNKCVIGEKLDLRIGGSGTIKIGDNCKIGSSNSFYTNSNWMIADNVIIASNCALFARESGISGNLNIGNGSHIGDGTIIDLTDNVDIGQEIAIGPNCTLYTHDHDYKSTINKPSWKGPLQTYPIKIDDGAWIGSNVIILPGVIIGKKSIIAAGSVVTTNVPSNSLYGGIPARLIKSNLVE